MGYLVIRALAHAVRNARRPDAGDPGSHASATPGAAGPAPKYLAAALRGLPEAAPHAVLKAAPLDMSPHQGHCGLLVRADAEIEVRTEPRGVAFARLPSTYRDQPLWLPVIDQRDGWVQVLLPVRTVRATGWLDADRVTLGRSRHELRIYLHDARLALVFCGRAARSWRIDASAVQSTLLPGRTFLLEASRNPARPALRLASRLRCSADAMSGAISPSGPDNDLTVPAAAGPALARVTPGTLIRIHP